MTEAKEPVKAQHEPMPTVGSILLDVAEVGQRLFMVVPVAEADVAGTKVELLTSGGHLFAWITETEDGPTKRYAVDMRQLIEAVLAGHHDGWHRDDPDTVVGAAMEAYRKAPGTEEGAGTLRMHVKRLVDLVTRLQDRIQDMEGSGGDVE